MTTLTEAFWAIEIGKTIYYSIVLQMLENSNLNIEYEDFEENYSEIEEQLKLEKKDSN